MLTRKAPLSNSKSVVLVPLPLQLCRNKFIGSSPACFPWTGNSGVEWWRESASEL
ncbi:hypothetical protein OIU77_024096 [Salix suchowensis]|uniref:Uncharacterized protein n=1 Tax=Salix suchowensis TaxID=1278906 RepID=A0ABQ9C685_9ROSI|nr:hypothetical protein OIU77_024096 [Salix suchowensis]